MSKSKLSKTDMEQARRIGTHIAELDLPGAWFHTGHPQLDGLSPRAACNAGRMDDVERILAQLADGAHA